jgi:hypothetical protein
LIDAVKHRRRLYLARFSHVSRGFSSQKTVPIRPRPLAFSGNPRQRIIILNSIPAKISNVD